MFPIRISSAVKYQKTIKLADSVSLLGIDPEDAYAYLLNDGYDIDVHVLDHIIPCIKFDLTEELHQRVCFNYLNMQPLSQEDNSRKNDGLPYEWEIKIWEIGENIGEDVEDVIEHVLAEYEKEIEILVDKEDSD